MSENSIDFFKKLILLILFLKYIHTSVFFWLIQ